MSFSAEAAWRVLGGVPDPEIPAISILDLGIVRVVSCEDDRVAVTVTPTYGGCPATEVIREDICKALQAAGAREVAVTVQLTPAWTTDWLSEDTKARLKAYGIAPPAVRAGQAQPLRFRPRIRCPRCESAHTEQLAAFGATACKALFRCLDCLEPFEYFKPI